jgi:hypothetical protein
MPQQSKICFKFEKKSQEDNTHLVGSKPFIVWAVKDTLYVRLPHAGKRGINVILCVHTPRNSVSHTLCDQPQFGSTRGCETDENSCVCRQSKILEEEFLGSIIPRQRARAVRAPTWTIGAEECHHSFESRAGPGASASFPGEFAPAPSPAPWHGLWTRWTANSVCKIKNMQNQSVMEKLEGDGISQRRKLGKGCKNSHKLVTEDEVSGLTCWHAQTRNFFGKRNKSKSSTNTRIWPNWSHDRQARQAAERTRKATQLPRPLTKVPSTHEAQNAMRPHVPSAATRNRPINPRRTPRVQNEKRVPRGKGNLGINPSDDLLQWGRRLLAGWCTSSLN